MKLPLGGYYLPIEQPGANLDLGPATSSTPVRHITPTGTTCVNYYSGNKTTVAILLREGLESSLQVRTHTQQLHDLRDPTLTMYSDAVDVLPLIL